MEAVRGWVWIFSGIAQCFIWGGFAQMSNPLPSLLYTIFDGKGTLFIYPLLTK